MTEQVQVGVIGAGLVARARHLPSLNSHPRARVAALCCRTREHAERTAQAFDIPQVYTDYRAMIDQGGLDAVVVTTPDDLHYPMTIDALDAGLHVFCEKPLASNAAQAQEMLAKAEAAGLVHGVFFTWRWRPQYRYLKELVEGGYLGRPYHCHIRYLGGYGRQARYAWRFDGRRANGVLGDLGSHMIDLARWTTGEITCVCACLNAFVERPGPEGGASEAANDAAMLLLQFENGAQGAIHVSAVACTTDRVQEQHIVLHGARGTLEADHSFQGSDWARMAIKTPCQVRGAREGDARFEVLPLPDRLWENADPEDSGSVFTGQSAGARAFIDAIVEGRPMTPGFGEGVKAQQVIDAALRSHREGGWVAITQ
jgi:predicted dehydrogenase